MRARRVARGFGDDDWPLSAAQLCGVVDRGARGAPLVLALVYGIIGGVASLLPDNPYMPPDIRFYHAIETSASNFLFGLVVGFLFSRGGRLIPARA
jgi:hypothetical protein